MGEMRPTAGGEGGTAAVTTKDMKYERWNETFSQMRGDKRIF